MRGRSRTGPGAIAVAVAVLLMFAGLLAAQVTRPPASAAQRATTSVAPAPATSYRSGAPNIVVVNTDDQRPDSIGALPRIRQWLVRGGTTYTRGYASIPSCCPSRATMFSGRYAHNNGQRTQRVPALDMSLTVQRWLQDAGYFTGHSGKYIHWWPLDKVPPYWDRWTGLKGAYTDIPMNFDGKVEQTKGYSTDIVFNRAIEYLDDFEQRDDARPFFLSIAPRAPHLPSTPAPQYARAPVPPFRPDPAYQEADRSDKPRWVRNHRERNSYLRRLRADMIRTLYSVDDGVNRLMRKLQANGELANTMVIFTSDNGFSLGEHGWLTKFLPYRGSVQVPFIVRWPGHVAAGARDNRFVTHADIAPTVLKAAGVTQRQVRFDGRNFLGPKPRRRAFFEYWNDSANNQWLPSWASLRTARYQYTEYYSREKPRRVTFREYYDMRRDPYQLRNLFRDGRPGNDPDYSRLTRILREQRKCVGSDCW